MTDNKQNVIFVAGHNGLVGSALLRQLKRRGYTSIITRNRDELDLTVQSDVLDFFQGNQIDVVYLAAATVGGIVANLRYPADFVYSNLQVQLNVIHSAWLSGVRQLLFLGSSCIYPRLAPQPMTEEALLGGPLEPSNESYAVAKIAGMKMCESYNRQYGKDYRSVMPTNLYGPGDNYHPENSHVIPGLLRRFHEATVAHLPTVHIWGTGTARREFLYVDDLASACLHLMEMPAAAYQRHLTPSAPHINIGTGVEVDIAQLAALIAKVVGYSGAIAFDSSKPDGAPRKLLDVGRLRQIGWSAEVPLEDGLHETYQHFLRAQREGQRNSPVRLFDPSALGQRSQRAVPWQPGEVPGSRTWPLSTPVA